MNNSDIKGELYFDHNWKRYLSIFKPSCETLWIVSCVGFIICLVSLMLYTRVAFIIYKNKSSSFSNSFYTLIVHLSAADCLFLLIQLTIGYPVTLIGFKKVSQTFVVVCGFMVILLNLLIPQLIILLAVNRYVAVFYSISYKTIFSPKRVRLIVFICWLFSTTIATISYSCTCFAFKIAFSWETSCSNVTCIKVIYYIAFFVWGTFTLAVPFIYILFYVQYKLKKRELAIRLHQKFKIESTDLKMLIQSFTISCVLFLLFILFFIQNSTQNTLIDIALSVFSCVNSSVNPFLYMIFNSDIRQKMLNRATNRVYVKQNTVVSNRFTETVDNQNF